MHNFIKKKLRIEVCFICKSDLCLYADRFDEGMKARITPNRSPCSGRHQSTPSPINNPGSWGQSATQMEKVSLNSNLLSLSLDRFPFV